MILFITEDEFRSVELITQVTNLLNAEEISSLFSLEEETSVLNSVRTQVQQAGLSFSRAVAWEFFLRYRSLPSPPVFPLTVTLTLVLDSSSSI